MSDLEKPSWGERAVARVWGNASRELEKQLKEKMNLTLYYNNFNAKLTETLEDIWLITNDHSLPIEWRVTEISTLVERLSTVAGSRDAPALLEMRSNYREFTHWFWYGYCISYLDRRRALGRSRDPYRLPLGKALEMVKSIGESYFIPMGGDCVDATFGREFHSPQFVLSMQAPPQMFPFGQDQRFSGEETQQFAEDVFGKE